MLETKVNQSIVNASFTANESLCIYCFMMVGDGLWSYHLGGELFWPPSFGEAFSSDGSSGSHINLPLANSPKITRIRIANK